ncbi:RsmB/NOP family class I SAM-dependent RNA methyltransferase [Acidianus manzaensis]|uniref:Fmu (Sun) domain-containing protein n=1 Tax=Acidianus manzaensis TaxID=282676 RepID=A0A1W6JXJ2_9CREN|nr:RsmB/NOP family class I SAM-dependent RNA methyltransferase [Acidianus manzaensis]ARM74952.1 Fmu (Sun) domain-containing protein [Acidianus manzaensis]
MGYKKLFTKALILILSKNVSLEKAFDSSFKLYGKGNRKILFEEFKKFIIKYLYSRNVYPGYSINQIYNLEVKNIDPEFTIPVWAYYRLYPLLGREGLKGIYNRKKWIRVNTLKSDLNQIVTSLREKGYTLIPTEIPYLFELNSDNSITKTKEFEEGYIILQDKASILSILFLDPKPNERILEIGSAPGIKTSLIQQITKNRSYVVAIDVSTKRVLMQKQLMKKLEVNNVDLIISDGLHLPIRKADKIFIDAPCSNSGTINVDPSVFIRLAKKDIIKLSRLQKGILREASKLKTIVVYTTCSLFPEEGEKVIEDFEKYLIKIPNKGHEGYKKSKVWLRVYRTYPHKDFSEGFFIAKLDFSNFQE